MQHLRYSFCHKCKGACQTDWRRLWEQVLSAGVKGCSGPRQQSIQLNKTTVVLELKLDRTDAKPSVEDLARKQDNS
jgi:hypothetical protein